MAHRRQSLRLPDYDYSHQGAYFVTTCVKDKKPLFAKILNGEMVSNENGSLVLDTWNKLPAHYPHIALDAFMVMPNHVHDILMIVEENDQPVGAGLKPAPTKPLSEVVRAFKTFSARAINLRRGASGQPVWQRGYYEHVIRNETSLNRIRDYIATNPLRWHLDRENPQAQGKDEFDTWLAGFTVKIPRL
ncbi:MAG: transposase [Desulfobaccales bacterium]